MDRKELRNLAEPELKRELAQAREELRRMRFDVRQGALTKVHRFAETRRMIARIETVLRQRAAAPTV